MDQLVESLNKVRQLTEQLAEAMRYQTNWAAIGMTGAQFGTAFVQGQRQEEMNSLINDLALSLLELQRFQEGQVSDFDFSLLEQAAAPFIRYEVSTWFQYQQNKKVRSAVKQLQKALNAIRL